MFAAPISIKEAIDSIDKREYLLPAIQREFVWSTDQIEKLFDSILKQYPINSFLFWEVDTENINKYQFYDFIQDYHERDNAHNKKANVSNYQKVTAILDGQQRLTALYIGLKGSYASKMQRKWWGNDSAFPKKKLYLNLFKSVNEDSDDDYEFRFLTDEEGNNNDETHQWFLVGDIFKFKNLYELTEYFIDRGLNQSPLFRNANKVLYDLYKAIFDLRPINFFLEKSTSLDKVLNIFIRVNSGGTKLSYSDLLLSIATAQWKTQDAREEIIKFVDEINGIGEGFGIDKDFVLKTCLVLCDFGNIAFKVDNFNRDSMSKIESEWPIITNSIRGAYYLANSMGFNWNTLTSNAVMIPVAYYLKKIGNPKNYIESAIYKEDRAKIMKYIIISLLKRNFSGQPDNLLRPLREVIAENHSQGFPFEAIIEKQKGTTKNYSFDDDEIRALFDYQWGQSYTFSILAILYPGLDFNNKFHIDHIFPKSRFTIPKLRNAGIPEEEYVYYQENFNRLANLQLLAGTPNIEKSDRDFNDWLDDTHPKGTHDRATYLENNFIPADIDLSFSNFEEFIEKRKQIIFNTLKARIN